MVRVSRQDVYLPTPLLTKEGTPLGTTDVLPSTHTISGRTLFSSSQRGAHGHITAPGKAYPTPRRILGTSHATVSSRLSKATVI